MAERVVLGLSALVWLPYGIFCFLQPGFLEGSAGIAAYSPTGTIEIQAMYGGLQAAIGGLCVAALWRTELVRPALVTLAFLAAGLFAARLTATAVEGSLDAYTGFALGFELATAAAALWLLRRAATSPAHRPA